MGHPEDLAGGSREHLWLMLTNPPRGARAWGRPRRALGAQFHDSGPSPGGEGPPALRWSCSRVISHFFGAFQIPFEAPHGAAFKGCFDHLCPAFRALVTRWESRCLARGSLRHFLLVKAVPEGDSILRDVPERGPLLSCLTPQRRTLLPRSEAQRPPSLSPSSDSEWKFFPRKKPFLETVSSGSTTSPL